ncbi:hypothetical protein AGLY_005617 [Aphis glycines]|uniref:Uncharacterized protein n=1 Tax=Aphis glycines TaxID=307491 RepID=A0A6G0TTQ8_APHGL|nr:hypothetical protein AGLY_005617 [Aphis glycines]
MYIEIRTPQTQRLMYSNANVYELHKKPQATDPHIYITLNFYITDITVSEEGQRADCIIYSDKHITATAKDTAQHDHKKKYGAFLYNKFLSEIQRGVVEQNAIEPSLKRRENKIQPKFLIRHADTNRLADPEIDTTTIKTTHKEPCIKFSKLFGHPNIFYRHFKKNFSKKSKISVVLTNNYKRLLTKIVHDLITYVAMASTIALTFTAYSNVGNNHSFSRKILTCSTTLKG